MNIGPSPFTKDKWRPTRKNPSTMWCKWEDRIYLIGKNSRGYWVRVQQADNGAVDHFLSESYATFLDALGALILTQEKYLRAWWAKLEAEAEKQAKLEAERQAELAAPAREELL